MIFRISYRLYIYNGNDLLHGYRLDMCFLSYYDMEQMMKMPHMYTLGVYNRGHYNQDRLLTLSLILICLAQGHDVRRFQVGALPANMLGPRPVPNVSAF